jgi:hypothetical protein
MAAATEETAAAELMRFLRLQPPAQVTWNGRSLVVEAAGQVLPERPTVWLSIYEVIYHP